MPSIHIIVPAAGLQPFEQGESMPLPFALSGSWREVPDSRIALHENSLSLPWEIAYARSLGLPSQEGRIAWAAYASRTLALPCAWVHPCHLDVGMTDMVLQPLESLQLSESESRELLAVVSPYFEQDGIALHFHSPGRWLAQGAAFADLPCASAARVQGRSINEFLPKPGEHPMQLQLGRLQAEIQMLLYTHPLSDARSQRGLPSVNSFWVDGAGVLDVLPAQASQVRLELRLQDAQHEKEAYLSAWRSLEAEWAQMEPGCSVTLCGERSAITLQAQKPSFKQRMFSMLTVVSEKNWREML